MDRLEVGLEGISWASGSVGWLGGKLVSVYSEM